MGRNQVGMKAVTWQMCSGRQVVAVCGTLDIEAACMRAAHAVARGRLTVVVGLVRSPISRCWYVGLSRQGDPLIWISVHRIKRDAMQQIPLVLRAGQESDLRDDMCWEKLQRELAMQSEPDLGDPQAGPRLVSRSRLPRHWHMKVCETDEEVMK